MAHTQEVRESLEGVLGGMVASESGYRGWLLCRQPEFLDPYKDGTRRVNYHLDRLEELTSDNKVQVQNLPVLRQAVRDKNSLIERTIMAGQKDDTRAVPPLVIEGRRAMDRIRLVVQQMLSEEDRLMRQRNESLRISYIWMVANIVCYSALVLTALVLMVFRKDLVRRPPQPPDQIRARDG